VERRAAAQSRVMLGQTTEPAVTRRPSRSMPSGMTPRRATRTSRGSGTSGTSCRRAPRVRRARRRSRRGVPPRADASQSVAAETRAGSARARACASLGPRLDWRHGKVFGCPSLRHRRRLPGQIPSHADSARVVIASKRACTRGRCCLCAARDPDHFDRQEHAVGGARLGLRHVSRVRGVGNPRGGGHRVGARNRNERGVPFSHAQTHLKCDAKDRRVRHGAFPGGRRGRTLQPHSAGPRKRLVH
jgi:hypothetical protein